MVVGRIDVKSKKQIYHITKLENFKNICKYGLVSRSELMGNGIEKFNDSANSDIILKRKRMGLDKCIPFHFIHNSPCAYMMQNENVDEEFVILAMDRKVAKYRGFKVCPTHPLHMGEGFQLYGYDEGFNKIDWKLMGTYNQKSYEDQETMRRRNMTKMAECLSEESVPITDFSWIYVTNDIAKLEVEKILENNKNYIINETYLQMEIENKGFNSIEEYMDNMYKEYFNDYLDDENLMEEEYSCSEYDIDLDMDYEEYYRRLEEGIDDTVDEKSFEEKFRLDEWPKVKTNQNMFNKKK